MILKDVSQQKIDLETQKDSDGAFQLPLNKLKDFANLAKMDAEKVIQNHEQLWNKQLSK
ncbi:MAG: hypothetical protein U0T80_06990 [Flavobacteriaceae bacterium]